jgi:hypothetical protein
VIVTQVGHAAGLSGILFRQHLTHYLPLVAAGGAQFDAAIEFMPQQFARRRQSGETRFQIAPQGTLVPRREPAPVKCQRAGLALDPPAERAHGRRPAIGLGQCLHGRLGQRHQTVPTIRQAPLAAVATPHFGFEIERQQRPQILQPAPGNDHQAVIWQAADAVQQRFHARIGARLRGVDMERRQCPVVIEEQRGPGGGGQGGPEVLQEDGIRQAQYDLPRGAAGRS